jgi:hypothetical protein
MNARRETLACADEMDPFAKPVHLANGGLIRISADVVFHRDALRPPLPGRDERGRRGRRMTNAQLSLDLEW